MAADYRASDYWAQKARREQYPARSVYKLMELDAKFHLLACCKGGRGVLDLGAAPGSWSLYVLRAFAKAAYAKAPVPNAMPPGITPQVPGVRAVDLAPLSREYDRGLFAGANFTFIQDDMTAPSAMEAVRAGEPYGLVLSDAAPATTGNRTVDAARSLALVETALRIAEDCLAPGGALAAKLFQGLDTAPLLARARAAFGTVRCFKPEACRASSFETYMVCLSRLPSP
ncbi:MAG: RlmE family RNA methyltransferase [Treponema sp.]|jgi:23S rRNA (uridine2552-2'-O)-methyltransferase|nr:RlmE family RNA methyltransferase [Treponema sp.]